MCPSESLTLDLQIKFSYCEVSHLKIISRHFDSIYTVSAFWMRRVQNNENTEPTGGVKFSVK